MVKNIHISLEDADYKKLAFIKRKSNLTWHQFIMLLAELKEVYKDDR